MLRSRTKRDLKRARLVHYPGLARIQMSTPRHLRCQYPADEAGFFYLRGQVNSALEAAMIVWKYILLFTCLGIGVALCVGAISILRSPLDNEPPAWFAAAFGAMFFWGAFALSRWRHQ